jgi:hypothetical protein
MGSALFEESKPELEAGKFQRVRREQGEYAGDKALRALSTLFLPAVAFAIIGGVVLSEQKRKSLEDSRRQGFLRGLRNPFRDEED